MTTYREEWAQLALTRISAEATRTILRHNEMQGELDPTFLQARIEDAMVVSASVLSSHLIYSIEKSEKILKTNPAHDEPTGENNV